MNLVAPGVVLVAVADTNGVWLYRHGGDRLRITNGTLKRIKCQTEWVRADTLAERNAGQWFGAILVVICATP
jgi:phage gp45-like